MTIYLTALMLIIYGLSVAVQTSKNETHEDKFNIYVYVTCILLGIMLVVIGKM